MIISVGDQRGNGMFFGERASPLIRAISLEGNQPFLRHCEKFPFSGALQVVFQAHAEPLSEHVSVFSYINGQKPAYAGVEIRLEASPSLLELMPLALLKVLAPIDQ